MSLRVKSSVFGIESIDLMRLRIHIHIQVTKLYHKEHENTFELASKFVSLDCFNEPNKLLNSYENTDHDLMRNTSVRLNNS